jgi:putative transposase
VQVGFHVRERRACRVIPVHRSTHRDCSAAQDQMALRRRLRDPAAARVRCGSRRLHVLLRREGWPGNHQRVYRLYRLGGLSRRLKYRGKRPSHLRVVPPSARAPDEHWSLDFITDSLADGRRFRA